MQTFSDRLQSKYKTSLEEDAVFMLSRINDSAARMQQMMNDLLMYLRFGGRIRRSEFEKTDLAQLLTEVVAEQTGALKNEQAPIVELEVNNTPAVLGNKAQLQALFQQLFDNSLKFARQNVQSVIKIRTFVRLGVDIHGVSKEQATQKFCKIEFADNGIGFNTSYTEKIFQLFQRLHHSHEYPGTGIGLAISQKVVANHHGYLDVESQVGVGTTFFIYLPISD